MVHAVMAFLRKNIKEIPSIVAKRAIVRPSQWNCRKSFIFRVFFLFIPIKITYFFYGVNLITHLLGVFC